MARFATSSGFGRQMRNASRASQSVAQTSMKRDAYPSSRSQFLGKDVAFKSGGGSPTRQFIPPGVRATLMMDHFATLGVRQNASKSEIKSAYRNLAKQYHPDVCRGDQCQIKFVQISTAYEHALNCLTSPNAYGTDHSWDDCCTEACREELEDWEEWMGWEGAGTLDYM